MRRLGATRNQPRPEEGGRRNGGAGGPGSALRVGTRQMERLVRVPCGLSSGAPHAGTLPWGLPGLRQHNQIGWRQHVGPPTFLARPRLLVPANASAYCREQLKAILSHMNPGLRLRLCKAPSKDVGVQVSLRVDKSVQCSLGPRTLRGRSPGGPEAPRPAWGGCSPGMGRRARLRLREDGDDAESKAPSRLAEAGQQPPPPTSRARADRHEELRPRGPLWEEEDASRPGERRASLAQGGAASSPRNPAFQILERKYGYFYCKDCETGWESAYVWCICGTNKVYFKQLCCKCQKSFNPYRVEALLCQTCSKSRCSCPRRKRHSDLRRPHRQELCGRCKDKTFSCGHAYRFTHVL